MADERAQATVRLLNDMETLRRFLRLYPGGHPSLQPAEARIAQSARALVQEGGLTLSFGPRQVFVDQEEIAIPAAAPAVRVVDLLFRLGLAGLRLELPEAGDGLPLLARRLASLHEPPGEQDREALLASAKEFPGVELVPIDLSKVELVGDDAAGGVGGSRLVWAELAQRLSRDGIFTMAGKVHEGDLTPGMVLDLLGKSTSPDSIFDHLFVQLGEIVRGAPEDERQVRIGETREFLGELIGLLDPERQKLAIAAALRHVPLTEEELVGRDALVGLDLLLDAVELMELRQVAIPEVLARAIHRVAAPSGEDGPQFPADAVGRARAILTRISSSEETAIAFETALPPLDVTWQSEAWARELASSLEENSIRLHLVRVLTEAISLWPGEQVAHRSALRLGEEFVNALDIGDFETASKLAPLLAATRSSEVRQIAYENGVHAAVRALAAFDRQFHPTIGAILIALGDGALPAVLESLAVEESLVVRKRLLEVVARQGQRAIPYLRPLLDDPRWYVVRNAIFLLRHVGDQDMAGLLKSHLRDAKPQVLEEILKGLVAVEDPEWLTTLLHEVDSTDPERQAVAVNVASRIAHPSVVRALVERLRARIGLRLREPVAVELIQALGRLRDAGALPVLRQILELKQWRFPFALNSLRREAAVALAQLSGSEARRLARSLTQDRDPEVAAAVRRALTHPRTEEAPQ